MKVSLVIPAFNEEKSIKPMLKTARNALEKGIVGEVIVVDDGSTDNTKKLAEEAGFRVVRSEANRGKAAAMKLGAESTNGDILLFWDADLIGTFFRHFGQLVKPLIKDNSLDMTIGKLVTRDFVTFIGQTMTPQLSGQRAIRRKVFEQIMEIEGAEECGFGIELLTLKYFRKNKLNYRYINLVGIKIITKEQKDGPIGLKYRLRMYLQLLSYFRIDIDKRKKVPNVSSDSIAVSKNRK